MHIVQLSLGEISRRCSSCLTHSQRDVMMCRTVPDRSAKSKGLDFDHQNPTYPLDQCANFDEALGNSEHACASPRELRLDDTAQLRKGHEMAVPGHLRASRSARKRLQSSENAQRQACFAPFVGNNLHPPKLSEAQCCTRSHWSLAVASLVQWPFGFWVAVLQPCLKAIASS